MDRSSPSLVKINSIAIELNTSVESMEPPAVNEQFSIRGYVAGMRKKDISKCYPFERRFCEGSMEDKLPQLEVPRSTWWRRMLPESSSMAMVVAAGGGTDQCPSENVGRENDGLSPLQDIGNRISSRDLENENNHDRGNAVTILQTCGPEGQRESVCAKSNRNASQSSKKDDNSPGNKDKISPGTPSVYATNVNPLQCSTRDLNIPDVSDMSPIAEQHPSGRVNDETENVSSGSEGASRRRTEKLRSLDDIIRKERKQQTVYRRNKSASSSRVQTTATDMERGVPSPQRQIDASPQVPKGAKPPLAKRKASHEEDRGGPSINCPSSSAKRFKGQVPEVERTWRRVENSESELSRDAYARPNMQLGAKTFLRAPDSGKNGKNCTAKPRNMPAVMVRMPPLFERSIPQQQMEKPPSIPPNQSIMGNSNNKGKAPLDLSLGSFTSDGRNSGPISHRKDRDIPDLNLSISLNTSMMQGKQSPTLLDTGLPLNENLGTSASGSRAITEGRGAVFGQKTLSKTDKSTDHRATEEIPMDIVQYLAENQLQRKLDNSRSILPEESIRAQNARQIDAHPSMTGFGFANRSGIGQSFPISFSNPQQTQFGMSSRDESQFRLYSPFRQSQQSFGQQKTTYPASIPVTSGPCPSGMSDLLWPPSRTNMPPQFSIPPSHNRPFQANSSGISSFSSTPYKGKTVSDIKGREEKRSANWSGQTSQTGYNGYSNDTSIPAMQLLSLMDPGVGSSSSMEIGQPKSISNKTFSPCNNHPQANGNQNQNFLNGFHFLQTDPTKDLLGMRYGVSSASERSGVPVPRPIPPSQQRKSKGIHLEGPSTLAVRPGGSDLPLGPCTLNRNPADFSYPDPSNEFSRTSKDLISRKKSNVRERSRAGNLTGQKRQRGRGAAPSTSNSQAH